MRPSICLFSKGFLLVFLFVIDLNNLLIKSVGSNPLLSFTNASRSELFLSGNKSIFASKPKLFAAIIKFVSAAPQLIVSSLLSGSITGKARVLSAY